VKRRSIDEEPSDDKKTKRNGEALNLNTYDLLLKKQEQRQGVTTEVKELLSNFN